MEREERLQDEEEWKEKTKKQRTAIRLFDPEHGADEADTLFAEIVFDFGGFAGGFGGAFGEMVRKVVKESGYVLVSAVISSWRAELAGQSWCTGGLGRGSGARRSYELLCHSEFDR